MFYHAGMSERDEDYELCMRAENVHLPKEGFFGVTAATGGLAGAFIIHYLLMVEILITTLWNIFVVTNMSYIREYTD